MFGWLRRIRRINIFGFEIEFDHSMGKTEDVPPLPAPAVTPQASDGRPAGPTANPVAQSPKSDVASAPAPRLTVHGVVIRTIGKDLGLRVREAEEIRKFWRDHHIDTQLDWFDGGSPVVSIGRKGDIARCRPGDLVSLTFQVDERKDGKRGTRTIDFDVQPGT